MKSLIAAAYERNKPKEKEVLPEIKVGMYVNINLGHHKPWDVGVVTKIEDDKYTVEMADFLKTVKTVKPEDQVSVVSRGFLTVSDDIEDTVEEHHRIMRKFLSVGDMKDL